MIACSFVKLKSSLDGSSFALNIVCFEPIVKECSQLLVPVIGFPMMPHYLQLSGFPKKSTYK